MADHPEHWRFPLTQVELRKLWTYSDGARTLKAYRCPDDSDSAGSWVLVSQETGNADGMAGAGEFARRFRPVDLFATVTAFPTYLGTVSAPDGTALVDLILDRNPFMLANGPRRAARPHALVLPREHRDGWSSATAGELAACRTAMALIAAWYRGLDGGQVVFAANDSAANLDYLRDTEAATEAASGATTGAGPGAGPGPGATVTRNPRQEMQHAHLHAFYAEESETENHESSAPGGHPVLAQGQRAFSDAADSDAANSDAVRVEADAATLAAGVRVAAQPWGGNYCSYQRGTGGPFWVMPALGPAQDEFNRRLAAADGLRAEPDPRLGGAVNLVRPGLAEAGRRQAAERATADQRASFESFAAERGLDPRSLPVGLAVEQCP
jgi:hypothetical protein